MVCNVITYRARSAVRDAAKALAFPPDVVDQAAKALDTRSADDAAAAMEKALADAHAEDAADLPWAVLAEVLGQMEGVPRHLSIHVGGMLITAAPLVEVVPLERAAMPDRVVVQWDKESVENAGLIKIDLLSLRTLGAVEEALAHIREGWGIQLDLDHLPLDDPAVYAMLQRADTIGCFQVESRAQAQMLPRLRPTCFDDLVIEVALVRPGPIQGNMVHPYLMRRQGLEPVRYPHPCLEPALKETLGVMVFQEQVLRVAQAVAGFSAGQADALRRAIGKKRAGAEMAAHCARFLAGAAANGIGEALAVEIWGYLLAFSGYGFCKSHAAAFALVAYQTLYLKAHYPAAFYCALLNHQPMGFYSPDVVIGDARRHGVPVLYPDVNLSQEACTLVLPPVNCTGGTEGGQARYKKPPPQPSPVQPTEEGEETRTRAGAPVFFPPVDCTGGTEGGQTSPNLKSPNPQSVRLGLRYVHGLGEARQAEIVACRGERPFADLGDFCRRTRLPKTLVENLIRAGAMDTMASARGAPTQTRRDLLWQLGGLVYQEDGLALDAPLPAVDLPALGQVERMLWEYELLGLVPGEHLMSCYRERLRAQGVLSSADLATQRSGERVRVAGMVIVRQRPPSAKGYVFLTLEDESGLINLIVRPKTYERYRDVLRGPPLLLVEGGLQREGTAVSVQVYQAAPLFRRA
jgi:error-prone DNA polymerase